MTKLQVGVLALQGDYAAHERAVAALGHLARRVKRREHLAGLDALLLPGGESTTMLKFLEGEDLDGPIADFCHSGKPVLGTCAGAILLATEVRSPSQRSLDVLDMAIERNAYGRQIDSFITRVEDVATTVPGLRGVEAVFIRAPIIRRVGPGLEVLLRHESLPILVRKGAVHAATFHPEMTQDTRVLELVLSRARQR
ncbi:MAG: pyridoxal 5'-phosphate synthase glutaminase subunit PdxT [Planctomycetota bacterium]